MSEPTIEERKLTAIEELLKKKAVTQTAAEITELVNTLHCFFESHHVCPKCDSSESLPLARRVQGGVIKVRPHVGVKSERAMRIDDGLLALLNEYRDLRQKYLIHEMSAALIEKATLLP